MAAFEDPGSGVQAQLTMVLCSGPVVKVSARLHFHPGKEPDSKLIQAIGKINFLVAERWRALVLFWLSGGDCIQVLGAI